MASGVYVYVILLLLILFDFSIEKRLYTPLVFFDALWACIYFCSSNHPKLYVVSSESLFIVFVGILCFNIGYLIRLFRGYKKGKRLYFGNKLLNGVYDYEPNYKIIYISLAICILYYSMYIVYNYMITGSFSMGKVQSSFYESGYTPFSSISELLNLLVLLFIEPIGFVIPFFSATNFWNKQFKKSVTVLTIIMLLLKTVATAGRTALLLYFVNILISYLHRNNKFVVSKKQKIRNIFLIFVGAILFVTAFIYTSISRGMDDVWGYLFSHLSIPLQMLDHWKEYVDTVGEYAFGLASLNGFIYPIIYIIKNIFFLDYPDIITNVMNTVGLTVSTWVHVGDNMIANAYVSCFWFLYYDGRLFGVILGMLIFGWVIATKFLKVLKVYSEREMTIYLILLYTVIFSFVRMQFYQTNIGLGLFYVCFLLYRRKQKGAKNYE